MPETSNRDRGHHSIPLFGGLLSLGRLVPNELLVGNIVEGFVKEIKDFGIIVEVDGAIQSDTSVSNRHMEGLIHLSQMDHTKGDIVSRKLEPGTLVRADTRD